MLVEFKREELYLEVWQTPLTKLGEKYELSDNGIRKICKAMNIPLPTAGHWAKVAAGKRIFQTPLPAKADVFAYVSHPLSRKKWFAESEDASWLAGRIAFEKQPENQIVVESAPGRWHAFVRTYRNKMQAEAKKLLVSKKAHERYEALPEHLRRGRLDSKGSHWRWGVDRGQRIDDGRNSVVIAASLEVYERALAILNTIALAGATRGFDMRDNQHGQAVLVGHRTEIRLRITEQLERKTRQSRWFSALGPESYLIPTGRLRVALGESRNFQDTEEGKLESMLNEVFIGISKQVVRCWKAERAREAWRREWEEAERRRAEAEQVRLERERKATEELEKRDMLISEASQWLEARKIRAYVRHIDACAGSFASERRMDLEEWKQWALGVAKDLDRTEARIADIP